MLYIFCNKKGNISIILIGLISVMLLMTMAMSKRMSGHSQLLTLSDYTQISRYFLESYVGDVIQQMRVAVNEEPPTNFYKTLCGKNKDEITGVKLRNDLNYKPNSILDNLRKELKIECDFKPIIELTDDFESLDYPKGIKPSDTEKGKEKKGTLKITCKCEFNKRKYQLVVNYPFSVVYRMTPVIKDFFLFADNIYEEQRADLELKDKINILYVEDGKVKQNKTPDEANITGKIRPLVLLMDPNYTHWNSKTSGMIYMGPSDKAIFLNLAGVTPKSNSTGGKAVDGSEIYLVSPESIGLPDDTDLTGATGEPISFPIGNNITAYGSQIPVTSGEALMGIFGFCKEIPELLDSSEKYDLANFLGKEPNIDGTYWGKIYNKSNFGEYLSYASGIKPFGLRNDQAGIPLREIYGNVFGRFIVLTFWNPVSAQGQPLEYSQSMSIDDVPPALGRYDNKPVRFVPIDENLKYQNFMSRIMSGLDFDKYRNYPDMFMPYNFNLELKTREIYKEENFKPNDSFSVSIKFDKFSKTWFDFSTSSSEKPKPLEQRIGRTFANEDKFKEAVGYPGKFKVNGVVYVKGDLNLSQGMNLKAKDCSGGVILVDGNITLGNILRGENIDVSNFVLMKDPSPASKYFEKWNNPAEKDTYIGADKILTFVCLKSGGVITVKGNVLLGVQLVNFTSVRGSNEQIKWDITDTNKDLIFYGSLACNRLMLNKALEEFGKLKSCDSELDAPFFFYPPVMATQTPPLAVQIRDNMDSYELTSSGVSN